MKRQWRRPFPFLLMFVWLMAACLDKPNPAPLQEVDPATVLGLFNPDGLDAPQSVTLVGTLQLEMGCSRDWQPACDQSSLTYIPEYDLWHGMFELPVGNYEYKAVLNGTWTQTYGLGAEFRGRRISLTLDRARFVEFYYDHNTGWITDSANSFIAALKGFTTRACLDRDDIGEFANPCMHTWLQDIDGDGVYSFQTPHLPAGDHSATVFEDHGPNSEPAYYGEDAMPGGPYYTFSVPADRTLVTFRWDSVSKLLTIDIGGQVPLTDTEVVVPYCHYPCE